jgi:hypothetical protein
VACWDLNGNAACDAASEDLDGDGACTVADCAGPPGPGTGIVPEPAGVVGKVTNASGTVLTSGTIYFVPAADVAALPATTIAVDSTNDEPLEDTIAANGAGYQKAEVGAGGVYRLPTLTSGSYFVTFIPATGDSGHLPGGSACRVAMASTDLVGNQLDLRVSSAAPAKAHYVGSGACVSCHGRAHMSETLHRIGIWSPYESGPLQNFEPRFDELYQAIEEKFEAVGGTTIYYFDYDPSRGMDKYKTTEANPGANVNFTVTVRMNGDDLEMVLHNVANAADPDRTYRVDAVYGGGVKKQRYMTKIANAHGTYYAMLPIQFQHDGSEAATYGRTSKVWRDYNGDFWYDSVNKTFRQPGPNRSFEKNCVSCHATGVQVTGSDATVWEAKLVEDRFYNSGDFDFDGNGVRDEMNVGCESCHGPGSSHWESAGLGKHIVSPSLLTPEREGMLCGRCHSRPKGASGTDNPVNAQGWLQPAGGSRNDFLANYATTQLDGAPSDYYGDPDKHSKSHHQQYSDFIRTTMYKNGSELMSCSSCHDPHKRTDHPRQLHADPKDNVTSCGSCHASYAADLAAHLTAQNIPVAAAHAGAAKCVDCHATKTAKTGAGSPARLIAGTQYWENDITSHLFKVPDRSLATSQAMPVPYTNSCAACHTTAP